MNEQPGLAAIHTLLVREHNRVADRLAEINPHWDDERVFQEARKIVSAINQHITFNEFLPRILGKHFMSVFGCSLEKGGSYFKGYDTQCSAAILNEFSTAAYRCFFPTTNYTISRLSASKILLHFLSQVWPQFDSGHNGDGQIVD